MTSWERRGGGGGGETMAQPPPHFGWLHRLWIASFSVSVSLSHVSSIQGIVTDDRSSSGVLIVASYWDTPVSTVQHFQCLLLDNSQDENAAGTATGQHCCNAIERAQNSLDLEQQQQHAQVERVRCLDEIDNSHLLSFVSKTHNMDQPSSNARRMMIPHRLWTTESFQSRENVESCSDRLRSSFSCWRHYLWDDREGQGLWITEDGAINETSSTPLMQKVLSLSSSSSSQFNSQPSESMSLGPLSATSNWWDPRVSFFNFTSILSESGGMHRRLHHDLQIVLTNNDTMTATLEKMFIWVVVQIPSGMFINVEDAYEVTTTTESARQSTNLPHVQFLHSPHVVIDQEEPSFASPSHVVMYCVTMTFPRIPQSMDVVHSLKWDTLMHLRYSAPLTTMTSTRSDSSWITLPAPFVFLVELLQDDDDDGNVSGDDIIYSEENSKQQIQFSFPVDPPIQIQVAAGYACDLIPVLVITFATALIGTILFLYEMSL